MKIPYERRVTDLYYRSDNDGKSPLACTPHLHYHIEFFLLLSGETRVTIDTADYHVREGDLLMVFPNQIHRYDTIREERYLLFILNPDLMPEFSDIFSRRVPNRALIRGALRDEHLLPLLQLLASHVKGPSPHRAQSLRGTLLALFSRLLEQLELVEPGVQDGRAIRAVVDFCARNFTTPSLTLEILEKELHLSRYYISHLFSDKLNISFNDYINSLRISSACRLLQQTDLSITAVSERSGFNTCRTFNRSFVKLLGVSPSEYRRAAPVKQEA